MQKWRLIDRGAEPPEMNMAIDEAIARYCREGKAPPTLRFYQWTRPSVSLGYFQKAHEVLNVQTCHEKNIGVVRRLTGGRAVYHHHELTYSLSSFHDPMVFGKNLKETFHQIAKGFMKGLEKLGVKPSLWDQSPSGIKRSPLCFSAPSWYEISLDEKKLIGSAQRRWTDGFLQHGSLLLSDDLQTYISFFKFPDERSREKCLLEYREKTTSLANVLPTLPPLGYMKEAILSGFEEAFKIRFEKANLESPEIKTAERLVRERYGADAWNRKG